MVEIVCLLLYYVWLGCCRELAYVVGDDIDSAAFIRHRAYPNVESFKTDFITKSPFRMEIGPFYNRKLVENAKEFFSLVPTAKELIFGISLLVTFIDIDMDDYGSSRKCHQGAEICHKFFFSILSY